MNELEEGKKILLIQNEPSLTSDLIAEAILSYDNLCLEDFVLINPYKKKKIIEILEIHNDELKWQKIRSESFSEELLDMLAQFVHESPISSHINEAKQYFLEVLRSVIHGIKDIDREMLLKKYVPLLSPYSSVPVNEAIYRMRYYGDVFFKDDNLYIDLFEFLVELHKSNKKELQQEYIVKWGICTESISRCWPCLPSHKLTAKEINNIHLERIRIAANYIGLFPDSLFCESAYFIINDDLHYLEVNYLSSEEVRRFLENVRTNKNLYHLVLSYFTDKLRLGVNDLRNLLQQENYIDSESVPNDISYLEENDAPSSIVLNIGNSGCGKTSLLMGLANIDLGSTSFVGSPGWAILRQLTEEGFYPSPNSPLYRMYSVRVHKEGHVCCLQFLDYESKKFAEELRKLDPQSELMQILTSNHSYVVNIILDPTSQTHQNYYISEVIKNLSAYEFWKRVLKINIIVSKFDILSKELNLGRIIESIAGESIIPQLERICKEFNINARCHFKPEIFKYSIGKPILLDRYKYEDCDAKMIMNSLIESVPYRKRLFSGWLNILRNL